MEHLIMKKIILLIIFVLVVNMACTSQNQSKVEDGYWQTEPRLAMVLNETSMGELFQYDGMTLEDGRHAIKRIKSDGKIKLLKNEIVIYKITSDDKVVITTLTETSTKGFISKKDFENNFSISNEDMIEFGETAFVKAGTKIYDENNKVIREISCLENESEIIGKIIERNDDYYKISYNPDGSWQVFIKKEDLKYDGVIAPLTFDSEGHFTL